MTIHYVRGDATNPLAEGHKIIVHVCNDIGGWGRGFVLALSRQWKDPERVYREAFARARPPTLGDVQFVRVSSVITVANLVGQHGVATRTTTTPPIRYDAIRDGLLKVVAQAERDQASIHMPRIGCGLAGGDWSRVEPIIRETLVEAGLDVTVYDLEPGAVA